MMGRTYCSATCPASDWIQTSATNNLQMTFWQPSFFCSLLLFLFSVTFSDLILHIHGCLHLITLNNTHTHTHKHTHTLGRNPLDQGSTRRKDLYLATRNTHNRQTSMSPAGIGAAIPASERPQTHALDLAATGIGTILIIPNSLLYKKKEDLLSVLRSCNQESKISKFLLHHHHHHYHRTTRNFCISQCLDSVKIIKM
jgi:hypothetical protein